MTPYRGLPAGTSLNGIYKIDQMIGAGGMGEVYRGHEVQTGATVAVKMLLPDMAKNEAALVLFRREAAALLNLHHDAIVRYFLFTVEPALERPYLAMEFIDGRSLSDLLEAGPLSYEEIVGLVQRVASGFQVAHERGLVHRDVSPDNIIIPPGGVEHAKIIDFGIARSTAVGDPTIIGDGFAGKHNYVSPEQVGLHGHNVTFKSDIYSFGLVLFNAASGRKLDMGGSQFQLVEKRRTVPDLSAVDTRLQPLLERMLQPDPAERPASMAEIAAWFLPDGRAAVVPIPQSGWPGSHVSRRTWSTAQKSWRLKPWTKFSLALIVLLLMASGIYAFYFLVWSDPGQSRLPKPSHGASLLKQPGNVAALPKNIIPPKPGPGRLESIRKFLDQYDGGDCFLIIPVAISQNAAIIEGFSSSAPPFDAFAHAFRAEEGFDASVGIRQIAPPQCPAIKFVNDLHVDRSLAPRINLDNVELRGSDVLSGTIENFSNRTIELLLITDNGQVQNLSSMLKPGIDSMSFAIGLQRNQPDVAPQLLMAIASSHALDSFRISQSVAADILFSQALKEAKELKSPVTAATRFFKLEK